MLDYGMYPPEINSARIYAGPGADSMLAAAAGWASLAGDLRSQASNFTSIVSGLTTDSWRGPASTSMAAAAALYASWIENTAAQAEQTATQAKAAVSAYESTWSMAGNTISAGVGKPATLGPLSVPPAWTSIATPKSPLASALGTTPLTAPSSALPGMPGMPVPAGAAAANTAAATAPKYGFRPTVVVRSPLAG